MPKLIDYPRTSYTTAWELAEVIDDTGGKCAIETAARKLNRKVSGSFKAIIGSGVKFGLMTSKRDLLTTTTLFKRIKHAYDKQEEVTFHREAFLSPPLFTQLCRKFRSRELPVQMLDVMLIREFGVEEINAQGVAKAFVDGCRMVGLLDENNVISDIDALGSQLSPRRELASTRPPVNTFRQELRSLESEQDDTSLQKTPKNREITGSIAEQYVLPPATNTSSEFLPITPRPATTQPIKSDKSDAIANLFGFSESYPVTQTEITREQPTRTVETEQPKTDPKPAAQPAINKPVPFTSAAYQIQISGPGVDTTLSITEEEDITLAIALLEKIRRQLRN